MADHRERELLRDHPASACRDGQEDPLPCHATGRLLPGLKNCWGRGPSCLDIYSPDVPGRERLHPPVMRANELPRLPGSSDPECSGTSSSTACARSEYLPHAPPFVRPSVSARGAHWARVSHGQMPPPLRRNLQPPGGKKTQVEKGLPTNLVN